MGGLFLIVKLLGAAYLVYLGVRYWIAPVAEAGGDRARQGQPELSVAFFLVTVGNPKAIFAFFVSAAWRGVIDCQTNRHHRLLCN